jgi:hypothetical protein
MILADHHAIDLVFEVAAGIDPRPTLEVLRAVPDLGPITVDSLPGLAGETRIRATPSGPIAMSTLTALGEQALDRPEVRWVAAPAARTWSSSGPVRLATALGLLLTAVSCLAQRPHERLPVLAAVFACLAVVAWLLAPLPPVAPLLLPLAAALGLAVAERQVGRWSALSIAGGAALPALVAGGLASMGALFAAAAFTGSIARSEGSEAPPGVGGVGAGRVLAVVVAGLLLATTLAPGPLPLDLLDPVPRTATLDLRDPAFDVGEVRRALEVHGLGTVDERDRVLQVPLAAPWVEPFLADTAAALAPGAHWSAPTRRSVVAPWVWVGAWSLLTVALTLGGSRSRSEAAASLVTAFVPAIALSWGVASAAEGATTLALVCAPVVGAVTWLTPAGRPTVLAALPAVGLPCLVIGTFTPELWAGVPSVSGARDLGWGLLAAWLCGSLAVAASPALSAGIWPGPRVRRVAPRLVYAGLVLVHLDVLALLLLSYTPPPSEPSTGLTDRPTGTGPERRLGPHVRLHSEGITVLSTQGAPYATGFAAGVLGDDLRVRLEDELFAAFEANVPNAVARWLVTRGSALVGMGLDRELLDEHRRELRGDVDAAPERFGFAGASYTRKVYYHAIHDIGQALVDTPLLGCTGFAVAPASTPDGHWRVARAFDFDGGVAFDRDKVVRVHRPDEGVPFLSVSFAGIVGAVSGVNAEGIAVVINASGSDDPPVPGTPMTLIVREILQHARSLDDAERILRAQAGFVAENVLIVDADAGEGALFEVSPGRVARLEVDGSLAVSNHFRAPEFAQHASNLLRMQELTTVPRLQRAEELVRANVGQLDQARGAELLSDRAAVGGGPLPRGHRQALNADIATHGVVIDATDRSLWVSVYPNLSGGWVALRLDDALAGTLAPVRMVAADPDAWRAVELRHARELLRASRRQRGPAALELARRAHRIWPDHPEAMLERGLLELSHGDAELGRSLLAAARRAPLEYLHQERDLTAAEGR